MANVDVDTSELERAFRDVERKIDRNLEQAMSLAVDLVAEEARTNHDYTDRTGKLTNSIQGHVEGLTGIVTAGAEYALYVEEGTRPHEIRARHRKALRWPVEGGFRFAKRVQHPGTEPQPFLQPALDRRMDDIVDNFEAAVDLTFAEAGLR